jgi:hypothetical protein
MTQLATHSWSILDDDLGIDPEYRHTPKRAIPGVALRLPGAALKWYAVNAGNGQCRMRSRFGRVPISNVDR